MCPANCQILFTSQYWDVSVLVDIERDSTAAGFVTINETHILARQELFGAFSLSSCSKL